MLSGEKPLALYFSFYPIPEEFEPYLASGQLFRTDIRSIFNYQGKPYDYQIVSHSPDDPNIQKLVTLKQLNGFDVLFKLPIYFERDIARFAQIVVDAVVTHFVVFKIAFVKQVVGNQAKLQVFAGRVFHVGVPKRVAALFHIA